MKKLILAASIAALCSTANAKLHDRGNGLIYDDVLNITWLQDANYAYTSGYSQQQVEIENIEVGLDGSFTYTGSNQWANSLTIKVGNRYLSGWRLTSNVKVACPTCEQGYEWVSELSYMFKDYLGNQDGQSFPLNDIYNDGETAIQFKNLKSRYWNKVQRIFAAYESADGIKFHYYPEMGVAGCYAWAVHDGDVAPTISVIPVPAAALLFGSAIFGLFSVRIKLNRH